MWNDIQMIHCKNRSADYVHLRLGALEGAFLLSVFLLSSAHRRYIYSLARRLPYACEIYYPLIFGEYPPGERTFMFCNKVPHL